MESLVGVFVIDLGEHPNGEQNDVRREKKSAAAWRRFVAVIVTLADQPVRSKTGGA